MNRETLKALKGSIKKWEKIVDGTGADWKADNCPLCLMFIDEGCCGCPVGNGCEGTPYSAWIVAQFQGNRGRPFVIYDDDTAIAAVLELEFLRSLLPEKRK